MPKYTAKELDDIYSRSSGAKKIKFMRKVMNFYAKHYLDGKSPLHWTADEITAFLIKSSDKLNYENSTIVQRIRTVRYVLRMEKNLVWEKNTVTWVSYF